MLSCLHGQPRVFHIFWLITLLNINPCLSNSKPNFLFIVVDDLGYKDVGFMGSKFYETPNIDRLIQSGLIFTRGYSNSAVCSPSRASILTGKFTVSHGITAHIAEAYGNQWRQKGRHTALLPPEYNQFLPNKFTTLPEVLRNIGYKTFFAGKWHLGSEENMSLPTDHGFDENVGGYHSGSPVGGYFPPYNNPNLKEKDNVENLSMRLAKETSNFISLNRDKPFIAYLSFYAVHHFVQTTESKWMKYVHKVNAQGVHDNGFEMERILPTRKYQDNPVYAGLIEQMDEAVGFVLDQLEAFELLDNTVIIFTSDNGGVVSGDNYSTSNSPLRGGKGHQWEGGIRVPFVVRIPYLRQEKMFENTPVTAADLYPTVCELAGIGLNEKEVIDGLSLVPLFMGKSLPSRPLYWHYPHYGNQGGEPNSIIMEGNWKLIHYWEDNHIELYNLERDLGERNNLFESHKILAHQMDLKLKTWLNEKGAKFPVKDQSQNLQARQELLEEYEKNLLPILEQNRLQMLNPDWQKPRKGIGGEVVDFP